MHLVLDLSLTVAKPWLQAPSGIDRVEFAHARHWRRRLAPEDLTYVMRTCWGEIAAIPSALAEGILDAAEGRIAPGHGHRSPALMARPAAAMTLHFYRIGVGRLRRRVARRPDSVFLTVSNANLHHHGALDGLRRMGCAVVGLVHDAIPLTHPHCFRAGESERHARRLQGLSCYADAALAVSEAARAEVAGWLAARGMRVPPMEVAHLGLDLPPPPPAAVPEAGGDPYFLMLGSLEPRKNHALMLELWREMAAAAAMAGPGAPPPPRLVVVGRRPSDPHPAMALLERGAFGGRVEYRGRLPDAEVSRLLRGARALLFPSLAEGFGIPLAEALSQSVPVLASDIPAFREVGGGAPEFLHPLDGPGWRRAVLDYAPEGSARRAAQLARLRSWKAPRWGDHFATAELALQAVSRRAGDVAVARPAMA